MEAPEIRTPKMKKKKKVKSDGESTSDDDLKAVIQGHSSFFDKLIELIPARFYLPTDDDDDKPWFQGLSKSKKALAKKETKENLKRARRDRLDPERSSATTLDHLRRSLEKEKVPGDKTQSQNNVPVLSGFDGEEGENRSVTYDELRERLRRRIEACQGDRNVGCSKREQRRNSRPPPRPPQQQQPPPPQKRKSAAAAEEASNELEFSRVKLGEDDGGRRTKKRRVSKKEELARAEEMREAREGGDVAAAQGVGWRTAVSRAAGGKVHDDPGLVRKSIRKEKIRRQKSAQKWKERVQQDNKVRSEKQRKREDNIGRRKDEKRQRKIDKREKKLMRPGFEGRKEPSS